MTTFREIYYNLKSKLLTGNKLLPKLVSNFVTCLITELHLQVKMCLAVQRDPMLMARGLRVIHRAQQRKVIPLLEEMWPQIQLNQLPYCV